MPTGSVPANINPDIINMQLGALRTNQVPAMTFEVKVEAIAVGNLPYSFFGR